MYYKEKVNGRKPDVWFKDHDCIVEVDEGNHENYNTDDEKEREKMFERHNFKFFWCNPNDANSDIFKFVGEINLHISKLLEKNVVYSVIDKIAKDFEKIVALTKSKDIKRYAKNILPDYKKWKMRNQK